jgi:hypothetical protein
MLTKNETNLIDTVGRFLERHESCRRMGAADFLGYLDEPPERVAEHFRDYCAATLRDPRTTDESETKRVLFGIINGKLWPTDRGAPNTTASAYWVRWDAITHAALHDVLGECPEGDE